MVRKANDSSNHVLLTKIWIIAEEFMEISGVVCFLIASKVILNVVIRAGLA